ncbi:MAG: hypothetical protein L0229_07025 [Blastocatellia bacterium]|nr:hypothetical protein [Blastocatellia bacterium]
MIRLRDVSLPAATQGQLNKLQRGIDSVADYEEKVAAAKTQFARHNRADNPSFRVVRSSLTEMCSGARRCGYCEDSCADEVEHIKPKALYPEAVFVWENYLYACGPCNGLKNNKFAVFSATTGRLTNVTRKKGDPIVPPAPGDAVLIDPRREDPLEFMELDLMGTFYFLPIARPGSKEYRRANYTIEVLRLNERDVLPTARREAYGSYRARLSEYITKREGGAPENRLNALVQALQRMGHPTVWKEMKRQHRLLSELQELFEQAPEALDW